MENDFHDSLSEIQEVLFSLFLSCYEGTLMMLGTEPANFHLLFLVHIEALDLPFLKGVYVIITSFSFVGIDWCLHFVKAFAVPFCE